MIEEKWTDLALPKEQFDDLVRIGSFGGDVEWNKFFALACSAVAEVKIIPYLFHLYRVFFNMHSVNSIINCVCYEIYNVAINTTTMKHCMWF